MSSSSYQYDDKDEDKVTPKSRLELSVAPSDGSLLTAPLSLILNTATDALYNDLHAMVAGEPLTLYIPSTSESTSASATVPSTAAGGDKLTSQHQSQEESQQIQYTTKVEAMSSLSFQQRRHILASRIVKRIKSLSHVSALVAANLPTSATAPGPGPGPGPGSSSSKHKLNLYAMSQIPPEHELNQITQVASRALQHVRTSWVSADIAQDAMYFHHDTLWKIRSHPHDVLGAMEVLLNGTWSQMSQDCKLQDRYRDSMERSWDKKEMRERLRSAVRRKLLLGELGRPRPRPTKNHTTSSNYDDDDDDFKWNVVLEKDGTSIRVHHGKPRKEGKDVVYPMEARLAVLSESDTIPLEETGEQKTSITSGNGTNAISKYPYPAQWTLLSIQIKTSVKTGESNYQLELSKEQMFGFHQICERAMMQEELRAKKVRDALAMTKPGGNESEHENENGTHDNENNSNGKEDEDLMVARPLEKLLHISHEFSISWQMEILSSQAEALRKGSWAPRHQNSGNSTITAASVGRGEGSASDGAGITVAPVRFLTEEEQWEWQGGGTGINSNGGSGNDAGSGSGSGSGTALNSTANSNLKGEKVRVKPLAYLAIHFWEIDDRNGKPQIGPLHDPNKVMSARGSDNANAKTVTSFPVMSLSDASSAKRLTLEIRAVPGKGLEVSLSGGGAVMSLIENANTNDSNDNGAPAQNSHRNSSYLKRNVGMLLSSLQDPFELSVGNALLAAVVICADRRCHAIVRALSKIRQGQGNTNITNVNDNGEKSLPPWMHLSVECGSIAVSVKISYHGKDPVQEQNENQNRPSVLIFRLACDSRTGRFVPTFPSATSLLRRLVCNDPSASEIQQLRQIKAASESSNQSSTSLSSSSDKRRAAARAKELTGRSLRDAFTSLTRSIDVLGRRVGVGEWDDIDSTSLALREKSIAQACGDVCVSLMSCAGMSAVYGVGALAIGVAGGTNALPDIGGGPIEPNGDISYISAPPLSVVTSQEMVENTVGSTTTMILERELYGISASVRKQSITLHLFDMLTQIDSVTSPPNRLECIAVPFETIGQDDECMEVIHEREAKRRRVDENAAKSRSSGDCQGESIFREVSYLAKRLNKTWKEQMKMDTL